MVQRMRGNGELEARDMRMQEYLNQVKHLQLWFKSFNLLHIFRSGNTYGHSCNLLGAELASSYPC